MMNVLFYRRFNLIWASLHSVREVLFTFLAKMDVEPEAIDNTGLVITEYLTNLIRHSEAENDSVTLVISRSLNSIEVKLIDVSSYFHPTLSQRSNTNIVDGKLREGGMGLALINHYFPDFNYHEANGKNHFSFSLTLKKIKNRIVIIDDEQASLQLLNAYLTSDYECHAFSDEHQAYHYLTSHHVDLLLIDMNLSLMLADEFISNIKQLAHLSNIGIVVISADGSRDTMLRAHLSGVDDYLIKPVTKTQLEIVCERVQSRCISRSVNMSGAGCQTLTRRFKVGELNATPFGNVATGRGGDFLECINLDGRTFVFFGDVMGHGDRANRIALQLKGFLQGISDPSFASIAELVNVLNTKLSDQAFMQQHLVTFIALEISKRSVAFINAGHPLPVLLTSQQTVKALGNSQPLLGLNSRYKYDYETYSLGSGETLVLATDGVFESHENCLELKQLVLSLKQTQRVSGSDISQLWCKCLPRLSKEIDDSSLLVLN